MRRVVYYIFTICFLASCVSEETGLEIKDMGQVCVRVSGVEPDSKSIVSYDYERRVNDLQLLFFDTKNGDLVHYAHLFPGTSDPTESVYSLEPGTYDVWVLANGPSCESVTGLSEFLAKEVTLEYCSLDPQKGFLMTGTGVVNVRSGETSVTHVELSRMAVRVCVRNIINDMPEGYGPIHIKGIYLANVVAEQNMSGDGLPTMWLNQCGCVGGEKEQLIDGENYFPQMPQQTWRMIEWTLPKGATAEVEACVYGFENTCGDVLYSFPFTARSTVLVLIYSVVTPEGVAKTLYCPVVLREAFLRNMSYVIDLTLLNENDFEGCVIVSGYSILVSSWLTAGNGSFNI